MTTFHRFYRIEKPSTFKQSYDFSLFIGTLGLPCLGFGSLLSEGRQQRHQCQSCKPKKKKNQLFVWKKITQVWLHEMNLTQSLTRDTDRTVEKCDKYCYWFKKGMFCANVISGWTVPSGVQQRSGRLRGHRPGWRAAAGAWKFTQVERGTEDTAGAVRYDPITRPGSSRFWTT